MPWADSAPFRAHLAHLMAVSGLTAQEMSALTGVSVRLIRRLLHGRDGRPMRRIDPLSARRLLDVTTLDASLVRSRLVPADRAQLAAAMLADRGRTASSLARLTGLRVDDIVRLIDGGLTSLPQVVELRLAAAVVSPHVAGTPAAALGVAPTGVAEAA